MNTKTANLLAFAAGVAIGIAYGFLGGGAPLRLAAVSFLAGFAFLAFGAPHRNPLSGYAGWGTVGLSLGVLAPFFLLFLLLSA